MKPNTRNIAGRMTDFYNREIAILEAMRTELPELDLLVEQDGAAAAADFHKRREQTLAILAKEFQLLAREWDETDVPNEEREPVDRLAKQARTLIAAVQPLLNSAAERAQDRMTVMRASMDDLRRGKQVMRAYKTHGSTEGGGLDRHG